MSLVSFPLKGVVCLNQQKMGEFLRHIRKDKGLTQELLPFVTFT